VFFDDVELPSENLFGEENKGWDYANSARQQATACPVASPKAHPPIKELASKVSPAASGARDQSSAKARRVRID